MTLGLVGNGLGIVLIGGSMIGAPTGALAAGAGALAGFALAGPLGIVPGAVYGAFSGASFAVWTSIFALMPSVVADIPVGTVHGVCTVVSGFFAATAAAWGLSMVCGYATTFTAALILSASTMGIAIGAIIAICTSCILIGVTYELASDWLDEMRAPPHNWLTSII